MAVRSNRSAAAIGGGRYSAGMVTKRAVAVLVVSTLALGACGSDDDSGSSDTAPRPGQSTTANSTSAAATTAPSDGESTAAAAPGGGQGHCSVTITGAVTAEWTSEASGFQAFVFGGWLVNPSAEDKEAFALNCFDADYNIVGFTAAPGTSVPTAPGTYKVASSGDSSAPMQADVALLFDEGLWEAIDGTFQVDEFDDSHVSGMFSLTIQDSGDNTRTAEVTGEFAHSK